MKDEISLISHHYRIKCLFSKCCCIACGLYYLQDISSKWDFQNTFKKHIFFKDSVFNNSYLRPKHYIAIWLKNEVLGGVSTNFQVGYTFSVIIQRWGLWQSCAFRAWKRWADLCFSLLPHWNHVLVQQGWSCCSYKTCLTLAGLQGQWWKRGPGTAVLMWSYRCDIGQNIHFWGKPPLLLLTSCGRGVWRWVERPLYEIMLSSGRINLENKI